MVIAELIRNKSCEFAFLKVDISVLPIRIPPRNDCRVSYLRRSNILNVRNGFNFYNSIVLRIVR